MNLFTPSDNDQSIYYLGQIFGTMGTLLHGDLTQVLGAMFAKINSMMLVVGVLMLVYITFMGLMHTAQEGEFLGKHWNKLWVPLRTVLGIVSLIPTPTGYSVLQIAMMWVIIQGVGAADAIWNVTLSYSQNVGGLLISHSNSKNNSGASVDTVIQNLFQGLVCQVSSQQTAPIAAGTVNGLGFYCGNFLNGSLPYCRNPSSFPMTPAPVNASGDSTYPMGPGGSCGTLTYCNPNKECATDPTSIGCVSCQAQQQVLANIVPALADIATVFVQTDIQYSQFVTSSAMASASQGVLGGISPSPVPQPKPPAWMNTWCSNRPNSECQTGKIYDYIQANTLYPKLDSNDVSGDVASKVYWEGVISPLVKGANFLKANSDYYTSTIEAATDVMLANNGPPLSGNYQKIGNLGWLYAGAYFYFVSQQNNTSQKLSIPSLTYTPPSKAPNQPGNIMYNYRNNYSAAGNVSTGGSSSQIPQMAALSSLVTSQSSNMFNSFQNTVSGGSNGTSVTNPLAAVQSLGEGLLIAVEIIFPIIVGLTIIMAILGNIDIFVLGTGVVNPVGPALFMLEILLLPLLYGFIAAFLAYGAMLAVYVPLIPYIIFTFGAISWFISVIEAMAAAPFIAIGIMAPGGQHEMLGKAGDHALMMLFGIFLRPGLMVLGLIAGFVLSIAAVNIINASFGTAMVLITAYQFSNTEATGAVDILELIFFMGAYISLVVTALNKCFALIHILPDRVLTWIGGQAGHSDQDALSEAKGSVQSAAGGAGSAMASPKGVKDHADQKGEKNRAAHETKRKANASGAEVSTGGGGGDAGGGAAPKTPPKK